jgi:hypothetical protein
MCIFALGRIFVQNGILGDEKNYDGFMFLSASHVHLFDGFFLYVAGVFQFGLSMFQALASEQIMRLSRCVCVCVCV